MKNQILTALLITLLLTTSTVIVTTNITQIFAKKSAGKGLNQIPSEATDYPDDEPNAVEVHVTTAKKDILGDYHVKGEIKNLGEESLQYVRVTGHFYDSENQTVGVTSCCYTDPTDIEPGHTATFDSFAEKDEMSGDPQNFRLSYEWD